MSVPDRYGIVCNHGHTDGTFRTGAKLWLVMETGGNDRASFYGKSRGGRDVTKWAPWHRLLNLRVVWVPDHLEAIVFNASREYAETRLAHCKMVHERETERHQRYLMMGGRNA